MALVRGHPTRRMARDLHRVRRVPAVVSPAGVDGDELSVRRVLEVLGAGIVTWIEDRSWPLSAGASALVRAESRLRSDTRYSLRPSTAAGGPAPGSRTRS